MSPEEIKIAGVTVTYNNVDRIPYVMPYYERMDINKLIVYDNESTDGTVEMLKKYPFVEVRSFHTDKYEEETILKFKTETQHEFKGEYNWYIACDFDEVLYSERDFREVLHEKMCEGKTYFQKTGLNLFSRYFPPIKSGKLAHEVIGGGALWTSDDGIVGIYGNKVILFDLNKVSVTYNVPGCHDCEMIGEKASFNDEIGFFHLKFLDFDYIMGANSMYLKRMGDPSIECYDYFSKNMENVFQLMENRTISVSDYLHRPIKDLLPPQIIFIVNESNKEKQKKCIDEVKKYSDNGCLRQYGILFYGFFPSESADEVFNYGLDRKIFTMYHECTDSPIDAARGYIYKLHNTAIISNPWVSVVDGERLSDPFLYYGIEKVLTEKNKTNECFVTIDSVGFERFNNFISQEKPATLGCYMIVKNEEKAIKNCISSILDVCDEIVVVDTGCSDKTMEKIAEFKSEKIKTYTFDWINDFSAARNFAMSKIESEYSFTTDADEMFTPELIKTVSSLKLHRFYGKDSYDIWLLNYNGTSNPDYYLGGRQIVKNNSENVWRYKIHEKLYFHRENFDVIDRNDGLILHKHNNGEQSKSNYNKYAEIYFNELNQGLETIASPETGAHFFYYLFMTVKNLDIFTAKIFLMEAYDEKRILSFTEDQRAALCRDGYISTEELMAYSMVKNDVNPQYVYGIIDGIKEPLAKYILLKYVFCLQKGLLDAKGWIDLSYLSYIFGLTKDFMRLSVKGSQAFPQDETIAHNVKFINDYIAPITEGKTIIIDCTNGDSALPSLIYYFSRIFNNIYILGSQNIAKKYSIPDGIKIVTSINGINNSMLFVDGNKQLTKDIVFSETEKLFNKKTSEVFKSPRG